MKIEAGRISMLVSVADEEPAAAAPSMPVAGLTLPGDFDKSAGW